MKGLLRLPNSLSLSKAFGTVHDKIVNFTFASRYLLEFFLRQCERLMELRDDSLLMRDGVVLLRDIGLKVRDGFVLMRDIGLELRDGSVLMRDIGLELRDTA